jgi:ADP-heptose:LPS heptosyltransferase
MPKPSKTLVLTAGSLGDCVLTLPALQILQSQGSVTLAGTWPYVQLGSSLLNVEQVIPFEAILQILHSDSVLDESFWGSFSNLYLFFKDKDEKIINRLKPFKNLTIHQPAESFEEFLKKENWVGDYWLQLVQPNRPQTEIIPTARLNITKEIKERGALLCEFLGVTNPLVLHPGSGSPAKNAPLSFFRKAAEKAVQESGTDVLVIWGDAELNYLDEIEETFKGLDKVKVLSDLLMLRDLPAILSQARGYLGNDSGVTHLASACGIRTFAVFNTTDSRIWGPQEGIILAATQTLYQKNS